MAEISIAGNFTERKDDRFVRDCARPSDPPAQHRKVTKILTIASNCPVPDMVVVNGLEFYRARAA